jgi:hypothetical protein
MADERQPEIVDDGMGVVEKKLVTGACIRGLGCCLGVLLRPAVCVGCLREGKEPVFRWGTRCQFDILLIEALLLFPNLQPTPEKQ